MGRSIRDLTGQVFGRLTVVERGANNQHEGARWVCRCTCGNERCALSTNLIRGDTKSCGCLKKELLAERSRSMHTTHGHTKRGALRTAEYMAWASMRQRCYNETNKHYKDYGGRGITVCDRWLNSFENFLEDMGRKPSPELSLDRRENDGNYEPGNCRWADSVTQVNNRRCSQKKAA